MLIYENNVLLYDPDLTAAGRERQDNEIGKSLPVSAEAVEGWSWRRRLSNDTSAILGPIL